MTQVVTNFALPPLKDAMGSWAFLFLLVPAGVIWAYLYAALPETANTYGVLYEITQVTFVIPNTVIASLPANSWCLASNDTSDDWPIEPVRLGAGMWTKSSAAGSPKRTPTGPRTRSRGSGRSSPRPIRKTPFDKFRGAFLTQWSGRGGSHSLVQIKATG